MIKCFAGFFRFVVLVAALFTTIGQGVAHPHVWIDAQILIRFDDAGRAVGITHFWQFDEAFSAWSVQGLDTNGDGVLEPEETAELALEQVTSLSEYDFFTFAGEGAQDFALIAGEAPELVYVNDQATLKFSLDFERPIALGVLEIAVFDPEFYVAIEMVSTDPVVLSGAPEACSFVVEPPEELDPEIVERLFTIGPDVTRLPPDLKAAIRDGGNTIRVACGDAPVQSAQVNEVRQQSLSVKPPPFLAPPAELGLPVARDGILGWINQRQREFYQVLTGVLGELKQDNRAFFVLGGLSFLYGIFHAAGPGHGKLVISSYVLARERQIWRGIGMSFAAAMMQSLVAVTFVLVLGAILNATSSVMSNLANWFAIGSYGFVVLLGIWLVTKKLFNLGHSHDHDHDHDHAHGHCHDNHMIAPAQTEGSLRDMAAVVFAVGLRPCSGALVVLVFALSQGLIWAGIVATFLMGLGTALTVGVLATFALVIKERILTANRGGSVVAAQLFWWLEMLGAVALLSFGAALLLGSLVY